MDVLIVSGIWPPEVGGPASHGPEFGEFLLERGHRVHAVTSAGAAGVEHPAFPLVVANRDQPRPLRMASAALKLTAAARPADVVYSTGMYSRSALAATLNRKPLVLKLVSDPAYERARRLGLFDGTLESFQTATSRAISMLKTARRAMLDRADRIVIPSRYLAEIAQRWGLPADLISVVPNPAPPLGPLGDRDAVRRRLGITRPTFVFVGRLVPQKDLPLALAALRAVPAAALVIVGDGPERSRVTQAVAESALEDRVTLTGALPRAQAIEWLRAADAAVLPSSWENFPHAAVEALAAGTPVLATSVGGVPEIVEPELNGILVPPGDERALAQAMSAATEDPALLSRLREGAAASAERFSSERAFGALEAELRRAAERRP